MWGYLFCVTGAPGDGNAQGRQAIGPRGRALNQRSAELADEFASVAETYASILERAALRCDSERRLRTARAEREIARVERRNAARLRAARTYGPIGLEHLPPLAVTADDQV